MIVHYVGNGNDDTGNAVRVLVTVYVFREADKSDTHLHKQVIDQTTRVAVVAGKAGKVFYHNTVYLAAHYVGQKLLERLPVRICPGVAVIHIFSDAFKFLLIFAVEVIEQVPLVFDAVAVILAIEGFFQIFLGKTDVTAHFPASGKGVSRGKNLLILSVFCACHCSSFPITLHLYYTSVRVGQQRCL